eukprot:3941418-Rhodomonas_salina.2
MGKSKEEGGGTSVVFVSSRQERNRRTVLSNPPKHAVTRPSTEERTLNHNPEQQSPAYNFCAANTRGPSRARAPDRTTVDHSGTDKCRCCIPHSVRGSQQRWLVGTRTADTAPFSSSLRASPAHYKTRTSMSLQARATEPRGERYVSAFWRVVAVGLACFAAVIAARAPSLAVDGAAFHEVSHLHLVSLQACFVAVHLRAKIPICIPLSIRVRKSVQLAL